MRRVRGVKALIHDAVDRTVDLVGVGHEATARTVLRVLSRVGPLAEPAVQVDALRRTLTTGILSAIKGVNHAVEVVTDHGLDAFAPARAGPEALVQLRSDVMSTSAWMADAAIGAANGVVGDHLGYQQNGLDLGMALRGLDAWISPDGEGIPLDAGPRIVVLVHGLATTEWSWCLDAARVLGDPAANFGTLLQAQRGYTPVYVRYNTGRHISENGRALSDRLAALVARWPVDVEELLLVGHSMGGLVVRSACHLAHASGDPWVAHVRRVITLASPHQGAPLEKFGNLATSVLAWFDLPGTQVPADLINGRSAGIKDLRYGYVVDDQWEGRDPDTLEGERIRDVTLPGHVAWCFIAATVGASPSHLASRAIGDLLVRVQSASGPRGAPASVCTHHVGGVHHAAVQVSPEVYAHMLRFLDDAAPVPPQIVGPVAPADGSSP